LTAVGLPILSPSPIDWASLTGLFGTFSPKFPSPLPLLFSAFCDVAFDGRLSRMSVEAPAIVDVRLVEKGGLDRLLIWLKGIGVRQVRLACGLVMFSYVFSHFFNHALGNISYAVMESWLRFHVWWWRIPIVNFTLYAAAFTHFMLGLWA